MWKLISVPVFLWAPTGLFSQEIQDIETDRPDQTECSSVIPQKTVQIETGIVWESDKQDNSKNIYLPTTLIRRGVFKRMEFRIIAGEYYFSEMRHDTILIRSEGFSPISLGAKLFICKENKKFPQTAFIIHVNRESRTFHTDIVPFDFRFSLSHTLSEKIDLGYNLGGEWNQNEKIFTYIYTVTTAFSLSDKFGSYVEFFGDVADSNLPHHQFDAGITFLPKKNLQLDFSAGIALNENSSNLYLSAGLSWRIPK